MKKALLLFIIGILLIPLVYAQDITNRIAGNSTVIWFPQNLTLLNTSRTLIGVDLNGRVSDTGNPVFTNTSKTNRTAVNFDGIGHIRFDDPTSILYHNVTHENWTLSLWFNVSVSSEIIMLAGQSNGFATGDSGAYSVGIDTRTGSQKLGCAMSGTGDNNAIAFNGSNTRADLKWHHVVCIYNKTGASEWTITQWVDGNHTATRIFSFSIGRPFHPFTIGGSSIGTNIVDVNNIIDEVTLINYSLIGAEVLHLYNLTSNGTKVYFNEPSPAPDTTPPFFPINSTNLTIVKTGNVKAISQNVTDANNSVSMVIFFHNQTGILRNVSNTSIINTKSINYTVNLSVTLAGSSVIGFGFWANDSRGNVNITDIYTFVIADSIFPRLNMSLNDTSITQNEVVNISANMSDDIGLGTCDIITNKTGANVIYNFTLSGVNDKCSLNITVSEISGTIINFTVRVNDTSNNFNQSSTIRTVGDATAPVLDTCTLSATSITDAIGNTINFTCNATDSGSFITAMSFDINGSLSVTRSFSITEGFIVKSTYIIFESLETLKVGAYSIMNVSVTDASGNKQINFTNNTHITITSAPLGSAGGGGGGGGGGEIEPTIILVSQELICSSAGINYTISNIQGSALGYSLVTDYKNTRQKCRDILIRNTGIENITINLNCIDSGNFTSGFCRYINLSETKVKLEPNVFQTKTIKMCVLPLDENIEGDRFFFSIKTSDEKGICTSQLSNQVETGGFNGFLAKFISFRKIGKLNYPLIIPSLSIGFIVGIIFTLIFRLINPAIGILFGFITAIASFLGYLIIM